MNENLHYFVCPACQHELEVRTTTESTAIPYQLSDEFKEYIEERDNEMLSEWSSRWQ